MEITIKNERTHLSDYSPVCFSIIRQRVILMHSMSFKGPCSCTGTISTWRVSLPPRHTYKDPNPDFGNVFPTFFSITADTIWKLENKKSGMIERLKVTDGSRLIWRQWQQRSVPFVPVSASAKRQDNVINEYSAGIIHHPFQFAIIRSTVICSVLLLMAPPFTRAFLGMTAMLHQ